MEFNLNGFKAATANNNLSECRKANLEPEIQQREKAGLSSKMAVCAKSIKIFLKRLANCNKMWHTFSSPTTQHSDLRYLTVLRPPHLTSLSNGRLQGTTKLLAPTTTTVRRRPCQRIECSVDRLVANDGQGQTAKAVTRLDL